MKKILPLIILIIIIAGGAYWFTQNKNIRLVSDTVDVKMNIPLTGALATYGESIRDGVLFFEKNNPNLSADFNYRLSVADNQSSAKVANSVYSRDFANNVDIYISGVKPQTMAIIDKVTRKKIPHFTWVFDANITKTDDSIYRTWVSYSVEPEYYYKYISKKKARKVAIAYVNLPHTEEEFQKEILPYLEKNNIAYIVEPYDFEKNSFKDIAAKFREFAPELIVLNGFKGQLVSMVKYFKEIGLSNSQGNTICTYDFIDASEDLSDEVKEGIRFIVPEYYSSMTQNKIDWDKSFSEKMGRAPRYTDAYAYDMFNAILLASKKIKDKSNSADWYRAFKEIDFEGVTGKVKFNETGDLQPNLDIVYFKKGELEIDID